MHTSKKQRQYYEEDGGFLAKSKQPRDFWPFCQKCRILFQSLHRRCDRLSSQLLRATGSSLKERIKTPVSSPFKRDRSSVKEGRGPDTKAEFRVSSNARKRRVSFVDGSDSDLSPSPSKICKNTLESMDNPKTGPKTSSTTSLYSKITSPSKSQTTLSSNCSHSIDIKKIKELPSYPWNRNSCWLDASLQAIFCSFLLHPQVWKHFEELASVEIGTSSPSHVFQLYLSINARRDWPLSAFPGSSKGQNAQPLESLRDELQEYLSGNQLLPYPKYEFQPGWGWFEQSIMSSPLYHHFFGAVKQRIWKCATTDSVHYRVEKPRPSTGIHDVYPSTHAHYQGKIKEWLQECTQLKKAIRMEPHPYCWRKTTLNGEDDETHFCHGNALEFEFWTSLPIIMVLELPQESAGSPSWDFPKNHSSSSSKIWGVTWNSQSPVVFTYDSMQHSGYSQYNSSGAAKLMYGPNPSCPLGYWTNAVIYVLKGGHMAQQKFQELQFAEAQKQLMAVLSLTEAGFIDGSELRELSAKERRVWKGLDSNREFEIVQNEEEISTQILNTLESEPRNRKSPTWTSDSDTEIIHTAGKVKKFIQNMDSGATFCVKDIKLEKDDIQDIRAGQLTSWIIDAYFEAYDHVRIRGHIYTEML
ncbi:hypothetical protein K435DRAFT_808888 [Dendrothele bispora CBS 962.96]|uniref:Uncharacterized protein n=1 Tax=Dendrothele bispora (strain CBS 962.96) TaxID=1314807 RepID=A0A4S8L0B2_DENBC|nr:hypothetical protein K435DRAFT_808888 [Dendrothele bispora CBS 962.96]